VRISTEAKKRGAFYMKKFKKLAKKEIKMGKNVQALLKRNFMIILNATREE